MCKTIILISGHKRAGEDFVSGIFNQEIPNSVVYSMTSPLKDIIATSLGIELDKLEEFKNDDKKLFYKQNINERHKVTTFYNSLTTFQTLLQRYSEAMKKHFGESVWVDSFLSKIFSEQFIIISDWRSNIEYQKIASEYSKVITVRVLDHNIKNSDTHISETELDNFNFDYILDNTAKDSTMVEQVRDVVGLFVGITIKNGAIVGMNIPDGLRMQNYSAGIKMEHIE